MAKINALPPDVLGLIKQIAPELASLSETQREQVFKKAVYNKLAGKAEKVLTIVNLDWEKEREDFLNTYESPHTKRAYAIALTRFENWANREGINPAAANYGEIDNYIISLKAEKRAAASIRMNIAAASAFFSYLERGHDGVKNTFRSVKQRPKNEPKKPPRVPTAGEVEIIISNAEPRLAAALSVLAFRGLRCGALAGMSAWGGRFETKSKGKTIRGTLPERAVKAIQDAGLSLKKPFEGLVTNNLQKKVEYHVKRLYRIGKLARLDSQGEPIIFSCHSFRSYFAIQEYERDKDLFRLKGLLGHSSTVVTDTYLRNFKEAV
jgi:integrase